MKTSFSKHICRLLSLCLIMAHVGCDNTNSSGNAIVQGTVTIDGVLATRGTVTFYPKKDGPVAIGQIHSDGSYALRTGLGNPTKPDSAMIRSGDYVVTVMVMGNPIEGEAVADGGPPLAGPRLTARKYAGKETSGLEFKVQPGRNTFVLQLDGAASDPPAVLGIQSSSEKVKQGGVAVNSDEAQAEASEDSPSDSSEDPLTVVEGEPEKDTVEKKSP